MTLSEWNAEPPGSAREKLLACCGAEQWAQALVEERPYASVGELMVKAEALWFELPETDWLRAFACHPRIGERRTAVAGSVQFAKWSGTEQRSAQATLEAVGTALIEGNRAYEAKFGFLYIVSALGRTAPELLAILEARIEKDRATELAEAARQQWAITRLRMGRLFEAKAE